MSVRKRIKGSTRSNTRKSEKHVKAPASTAVTAQDFNWGVLLEGTKAALVAAKLVPPKVKRGQKFFLPLDYNDRYQEACFGPNRGGPIPPRWEARVQESLKLDGSYAVYVDFCPVRDLAVRQRAEKAISALRAALELVEGISPTPISQQLGLTVQPVHEGGATHG